MIATFIAEAEEEFVIVWPFRRTFRLLSGIVVCSEEIFYDDFFTKDFKPIFFTWNWRTAFNCDIFFMVTVYSFSSNHLAENTIWEFGLFWFSIYIEKNRFTVKIIDNHTANPHSQSKWRHLTICSFCSYLLASSSEMTMLTVMKKLKK